MQKVIYKNNTKTLVDQILLEQLSQNLNNFACAIKIQFKNSRP